MLLAGRVLRRADHKHIASFTDTWNSVKGFHLLAGRLSDSLPVRREHCASHLLGNEIPSLLLQEYGVLRSFLLRSRLCHDSQFRSLRGSRWFHSSSSSWNQQQNNDSNKGSDKNAKSDKDDKEDKEDKDDKERKQMLAKLITILLFYGAPLYWMMMMHYSNPSSNSNVGPTFLSWSEFLHQMLAKGEVKQLTVDAERKMVRIHLHDGAIIRGKPASPFNYVMPVDDIAQFEEKLRAAEIQLGIKPEDAVTVVFERPSDSWGKHIFDLLLIGFLIWVALKLKANTGIMDGVMGGLTKAKFTLVEPLAGGGRGVKFSDIAGLKEAKTEVMEFVDYLKRPEHYRRLGAKVPKGTLLLGPPGCGKTLLAKAVATEANVPFLSMNGTEFIEVIGGLGASRVRSLFKEARKRVPCIVYIDEIDAIGRKRFNEQGGEGDQTLNQLLVELDGMATKEGVIMLASTNRAEVLDKALLRPGRFDRHILIDLPTVEERKEIFEQYLKQIKLEEPPTFYSRRLAHLTPGYSGADIANICNEAALHAARFQHKIVRGDDLEYAVERVQYGAEKKQHSVSFTERQRFAYYLAGRTLVGWMLEHTDAMLKVSVVQRTKAMGNLQLDRSERFLISNDELYDRMTMFIAGKAAESIIFNQNSTVSEEDLKKVTNIAYGMVEVYGMNQNVGLLSFRRAEHQKRMYSRKLHSTIDFEARKIIIESYDRASRILEENKDKLKLIAEELLKRESLTYTDICNLIGPPPFGHKRQVEGINFGGVLSEKTDSPSSGDEPPVDEP